MVQPRPELSTRWRTRLIGWRTLRRSVQVVDRTERGEPVVVVDDKRLVLPAGAHHFRRLVHCAMCARELVDPHPVMSAHALAMPVNPALCSSCAGSRRLRP